MATHTSAEQYLRAWVGKHRPGAQWPDYRIRPERSQAGQTQAFPGGGAFRAWAETGQALLAYAQAGRAVRETLAVTIRFQGREFPMVNRAPMRLINGQALGVQGEGGAHGSSRSNVANLMRSSVVRAK